MVDDRTAEQVVKDYVETIEALKGSIDKNLLEKTERLCNLSENDHLISPDFCAGIHVKAEMLVNDINKAYDHLKGLTPYTAEKKLAILRGV